MNQLLHHTGGCKKNFFVPLNLVANRGDQLVDGIIVNEKYEIIFDNDGKLYLMSDDKTVKECSEVVFNENKRLVQKRSDAMFKVKKPYSFVCFSKGLKTGIFCSLKAHRIFGLGKSYLHCELFGSSSSLFHKLDNQVEKNFKLPSKVEKLIAVQISSTSKFFVVVYKCQRNIMCEFFSLVGNEDNHCNNQQLELTKVFSHSDIILKIRFNEADTLCLFYSGNAAAVYSMKETLLFTIPKTVLSAFVNSIFLVNYSQKGDFSVYYEQNRIDRVTDDLIICYAIKPMCLERVLKFKLRELGINLAHSVCVSSFTKTLLFASNRESIYIIDLCHFSEQPVLLRTINLPLPFMQANLFVNWTGEELIHYGKRSYEEHHLSVYYLNYNYSGKNLSLLNLARNAVLTVYTNEQLRELSLPKLYQYYLGL